MIKNTLATNCLIAALTLFSAERAEAEVRLASPFSDHMVMQRDAKLTVWGVANPGEKVTVSFAGQAEITEADGDGAWSVQLAPVAASKEPQNLTVRGTNEIVIRDVLVGDVWLCGGQSNMEFPLHAAHNASEALPQADRPLIRLAICPQQAYFPPVTYREIQWKVCNPENAKQFSAVGYFFGREIQQTQDVPIGLIGAYWGGTSIQTWTSREAFEAEPKLAYLAKKFDEARTAPPGKSKPPTILFNNMIAPIIPFPIKGVIWYQGEANTWVKEDYRLLFSTLIRDWRARWQQGDFPFLFVQLAGFATDRKWAELRDAQLKTLSLPNTGMAVAIDVGKAADIHPKNKETVGHRLALQARAVCYGEEIVSSGPLFESMTVESDKARVKFSHTGGGLKIGSPPPIRLGQDQKPPLDRLTGFEIAGEDGKFGPANARIDGRDVIVWSAAVPAPRTVRYGWSGFPEVNLYNVEDLPASPFNSRTDATIP